MEIKKQVTSLYLFSYNLLKFYSQELSQNGRRLSPSTSQGMKPISADFSADITK